MPRNTAASKISNGITSLLWQLRCHCNPDHNKFSSLSNTTGWQYVQTLVYGDVVYAQTREVDPEKLYWATLIYWPQQGNSHETKDITSSLSDISVDERRIIISFFYFFLITTQSVSIQEVIWFEGNYRTPFVAAKRMEWTALQWKSAVLFCLVTKLVPAN